MLVTLQSVLTLPSLSDTQQVLIISCHHEPSAHLVYVDDARPESPSTYSAQGRVKVTATGTVRGRGRGVLLFVK